jgi:DNA-binding LacI/PurR family transcriptional regulator
LRLRAYKAELQAAGLPSSPPLFGDWTADSGYEIGRALTYAPAGSGRAELPFSAVFSSNDQMALGLIHAFRAAGFDVPRDVSITGFDDIPESAHFWPPLTTVRQDFGSLGTLCVTMLLDAIRQAQAPSAAPDATISPMVEPELIIRDSVAPPPERRAAGAAQRERG